MPCDAIEEISWMLSAYYVNDKYLRRRLLYFSNVGLRYLSVLHLNYC